MRAHRFGQLGVLVVRLVLGVLVDRLVLGALVVRLVRARLHYHLVACERKARVWRVCGARCRHGMSRILSRGRRLLTAIGD